MKRNAKTYGILASAPAGTGFRFMPYFGAFFGVDFFIKNSSNNLHISELFILSHMGRLYAR